MPQPRRQAKPPPTQREQLGQVATPPPAPPPVVAPTAPVVTAAAAAGLMRNVLSAVGTWGSSKRDEDAALLLGLLERRFPDQPQQALRQIVAHQVDTYEEEFQAKMRARLERDLPLALAITDPAKRRQRLDAIRGREAHFVKLRAQALVERGIATSEREMLRELSPEGVWWGLSDAVKQHTVDCKAMAGKFWPWSVVDRIHPQLHHGCACQLYGRAEALERGLMRESDIKPEAEMAAHARQLARSIPELRHHLGEARIQAYVDASDAGLTHEVALREAGIYQEAEHLRNRLGRWRDMPDLPRTPRPAGRRTVVARGYAEAAQTVADAYSAKVDRGVRLGLEQLPSWLKSGDGPLTVGPVELTKVPWDTGRMRVTVDSAVLDYPDNRATGAYVDDADAVAQLTASVGLLAGRVKDSRLPTMRRQMRGAIVANTGEGREVYRVLDEAVAANDGIASYAALRDRFTHLTDPVIVVGEKGYGRFPLGIQDALTTASRNPDTGVTSVNGLAMAVHARYEREWASWEAGREQSFKPGTSNATYRSPAALLRHEWAHQLWEDLSDGQRAEFRGLVPGWDEVASGLTMYAAGNAESRASYDKNTNVTGGYLTETFAEALAVTTDPLYRRDQWPDWVGRAADFIGGLTP